MKRRFKIGCALALCLLPACGARARGERCNPALFESDCAAGLTCVYPTAAACGVARCCAVDSAGNVIDTDPNCQADPTLACPPAPDLDAPRDGGEAD